jgi:hypothetical protein
MHLHDMTYAELLPIQCDTGCGNFIIEDSCPVAMQDNEAICLYCCGCTDHADYHE